MRSLGIFFIGYTDLYDGGYFNMRFADRVFNFILDIGVIIVVLWLLYMGLFKCKWDWEYKTTYLNTWGWNEYEESYDNSKK